MGYKVTTTKRDLVYRIHVLKIEAPESGGAPLSEDIKIKCHL